MVAFAFSITESEEASNDFGVLYPRDPRTHSCRPALVWSSCVLGTCGIPMTCIVALRRITLLLILVFSFSWVIRATLCIDMPLSRQISVVD